MARLKLVTLYAQIDALVWNIQPDVTHKLEKHHEAQAQSRNI